MREERDMENTDKTENIRLGLNVPGRLLKRFFFVGPIFLIEGFAKTNGLKNNHKNEKLLKKGKQG